MKLRNVLLGAAAAFVMTTSCFAQDISVSLNGNIISFPNQKPVVVEGRTLIPLRGVFDNIGYGIDWNGETKTVTLTKGGTVITINIGESCYYLNGEKHDIDVPAQIINGSTMLPLRAIGDASGCEILWDPETKIATILDVESEIKDPISGTVYTTDQNEANFINSFTSINQTFNDTAYGFLDYVNKLNTTGINSEADLQELANQAGKMHSAAQTAKNSLQALECPSKYQKVKDVSVKYMQSLEDLCKIMLDFTSGNMSGDEYLKKLNEIGTTLMINEAEYQSVLKEVLN